MSTQLEDLLTEGLQRRSAEITLPDHVFGKALRSYRRRRNGTRALVVTGVVATSAAVGLATVSGPATRPETRPTAGPSRPVTSHRLDTVAFVRAKVAAAVDASTAIVHTTHRYGLNPREERWTDQQTGQFVDWIYRDSGRPDSAIFWPGHGMTSTVVFYAEKSWSTVDTGGSFPMKPATQLFDTPEQIRDALVHDEITLVGHEQLRGRETVHLKYVTTSAFSDGHPVHVDTWVDAQSYLPLRVVQQSTYVPTYLPKGYQRAVDDLDWLPRSPENVAKISLTPPAGFKHVRTSY
jgi:hypothetical protein